MDIFVQIILLTVTTLTGYFILRELLSSGVWGLVGATCGLILGYAILKIELKLRDISLKIILGSLTGVVVSLFVANLFVSRLLLALIKDIPITLPIYVLFYFVMGYLGFVLGKEKSKTIDLSKVPLFDRLEEDKDIKLLDTSTIIDGRIADICETGFIQGTLVIPQFVLYEIQHIADHQDSVKRTRGRRGLDVLHRLQKQTFLTVRIVDYDFPKLKDVDTKLIALAKRLGGKIVTNDYNLNKVAELQGIEVLNMNQLAMSLRPALLPGEQMNIKVLREGKEQGQGIGYLDDGTMVVVDDARKYLGKAVDVVVTSVLQTTSGRMIFSRLKGETGKDYIYPDEYQLEEQT